MLPASVAVCGGGEGGGRRRFRRRGAALQQWKVRCDYFCVLLRQNVT